MHFGRAARGKLLVFLAVALVRTNAGVSPVIDYLSPITGQYLFRSVGAGLLDLPIAENDSVVISGADGATWSNGKVCFTPATAGVYQLQVKAYAQDQVESCAVTVNVESAASPSLVCPTEPYKVELCSPGQVCLSSATRNARDSENCGRNGDQQWQFLFSG